MVALLLGWLSLGVGDNFEFLAVTLHFHNDQFVLEKYMIGFEALNADTSYMGNVLYQHLYRVLSEHVIKDRIISIIRDNDGPMNTLMENSKKEFDDNDSGLEFSGDNRCAGYVLNLAAKAFLCCTSFRTHNAVTFRESFESVKDNHRDLDHAFQHTETILKILHQKFGYSQG